MRIGYLDCFAGIAGDMWVGALLDLGIQLDDLLPAVRSLGLEGVSVEASKVTRAGLCGTHFVVHVPGPASPARHLADLNAVLERADLPERVSTQCAAVFRALAEVEAAVHDRPVEKVHFHEIGAEDTIVDVVCACLGVHLAGFERLYGSTVETGSGTVSCAHGVLPVPAPGTLGNLLGIPVRIE